MGRRGVAGLLDKRLVFVTGKGGVGKTAVAAALGLLATQRGLRTIVAEVALRDDVQRTVGGDVPTISVDPQEAMEMYLSDQLAAPLAEVLKQSRVFGYLAAATPGMRELLTVGKLWELAQPERRVAGAEPYDLVVVDAPATGHGLALLDAPRTFAGVAAAGPIARQARIIHGTLTDRELTGIVAVATPEEMPVNEVELLRGELGDRLDLVVANAVRPDRFAAAEARRLAGARDRPAARAALSAHERARAQRAQLDRLRPDVELPFAPEPGSGGVDVAALTAALAGAAGR
ncbi:MAG TPA: ArsA-related P-loop ATPase [Solirubrobacteraceae bacterium]|nr:ArsA-related P-loop ATPase [Solirubrobacteraceae bacterium]